MPSLPPGLLSYFFHWLTSQIFWHGGNIGFGRLRMADPHSFDLELRWPFHADGSRLRSPLLLAYSPIVVPRPDDWSSPHIQIPGYFFLESPHSYQPPLALKDILSGGEPPVCVTFGSMIHQEAERIYRVVFDALHKTGNRVVVLSGWSNLPRSGAVELLAEGSADILVQDDIPHDWLLPRCKAVIHHGGAGTTAAGLHSGIPNLVISFAADQPFWGARVHAIGAGPQPIPVKVLTAEKLIAALVEADGNAIRNGAQVAGRKIRAENGVGNAVKFIEEYAVKGQKTYQSIFFKD
jgi:sterol 3beta-glucosyltransferase